MRSKNNEAVNIVVVPDNTPITVIPDLPNVNAKRSKQKSYLIDDDDFDKDGEDDNPIDQED